MAASVAEDDALSLWHLRDLRLSQRPERRPICYRTLRLPAGADDPQPLDDDLPEDPEIAGTQRRRLLWTVGLLALALRLVLLPIGHYWDLTIDYNTFIDLAHNHSPYDTMAYLSQIARSAHWDTAYEYYAYPPLPLYLYYPLAHLYAWLHPTATYFIPVSGTHALPNLTLDFFFLLKLPIWMADFAIAALLARMSGTVRGWRDYLLNPYVLLVSGAWTFDALMVLGLLAGAYWLQQGKFAKAGLALAFGTMIKFVPVLMVPTFALYLIKKQRTPREIALFAGSYLAGCVVLLGPFLSGLLSVLGFHSARVGGGMNWENYWRLWRLFPPGTNLNPISLAIGAFGTPTLAIFLLLAYWYAFTSPMRFNRMIIVTLLAFFVGSKLINEQYALILFPFAYIEARQVGGAWRWFFRLFWIVPLAFAIMHVPIDRFLWLLYHMIFRARADVITTTGLTGFESPFVPWQNGTLDQVLVALLGLAFTLLSAVALLWPVRPVRRPIRHEMLPASQGLVHAAPTATTTAHASVHGARDPSGSGGSGDTAPQPPIAVPR